MRIVFCGTPEFAVPSLQRLAGESSLSIVAVVTQPDRPRGRGQQVQSSPVKEAALGLGLHVYQPEKLKSDSAFDFFQRIAPDVVVIIAYGQIVPQRLLEIPKYGWLNLHASLLPKFRGAAPVQWAIAEGETRTGVTVMRINAGLDTGPTLSRAETMIGPDETAPELLRRLAELGAPLVADTLVKYTRGEIHPVEQDHEQASFAPIIKKEHGRINWSHTAQKVYSRIRGFQPWPGAYSTFRGQLCHVWGKPAAHDIAASLAPAPVAEGTIVQSGGQILVACGERTWLRVEDVQVEGRKRLAARDFANGARLLSAERFGG
ncbi:MAG: methionyl-tRNA formyltransferase [Candidatus Acidiferrales bacterium]